MTTQEAIRLIRQLPTMCEFTDAYGEPIDSDYYYEAVDMAIEALGGNGVAQERKYTFGNDEFNLEAAYHDCKLVFDGITDDDSFQEADTGLILYYANEIIYALHEALSCSEKPNRSDLISRQDAIDAINRYGSVWMEYTEDMSVDEIAERALKASKQSMVKILHDLPSVEPEIIRCKDCRWWDKYDDCDNGYCMAMKHGYMSTNWEIGIYRRYKGDFYCADAERRTNG